MGSKQMAHWGSFAGSSGSVASLGSTSDTRWARLLAGCRDAGTITTSCSSGDEEVRSTTAVLVSPCACTATSVAWGGREQCSSQSCQFFQDR